MGDEYKVTAWRIESNEHEERFAEHFIHRGIRESAETDQLVAALCKAKLEFGKVEHIRRAHIQSKKGASYQFAYSNLDDYINATEKPLAENGLVVIQFVRPVADEQGTNIVITRLAHVSGQFIESDCGHISNEISMQRRAPTLTYMRRYAYAGILGISAEDTEEMQPERQRKRTAKSDPKNPPPSPNYAKPLHESVQHLCPHNKPLGKGTTCEECDAEDKAAME